MHFGKRYYEHIAVRIEARSAPFAVDGFTMYQMAEDFCALTWWEVSPRSMQDLILTVLPDGMITTMVVA